MTKWLVLWRNNGRLGSVELTDADLAHLKARFVMCLIHRDASGTEHWEVFGKK